MIVERMGEGSVYLSDGRWVGKVKYRRHYQAPGIGYFKITEAEGAPPPKVGNVVNLTLERGSGAPSIDVTVIDISPDRIGGGQLYSFEE